MLRAIVDHALTPEAAPVWGVAGIVLTKCVDWLMNRRRSRLEAFSQINNAQKNLNDGLVQQIKFLQEDVNRLREEHQTCEHKFNEAIQRIQALEAVNIGEHRGPLN